MTIKLLVFLNLLSSFLSSHADAASLNSVLFNGDYEFIDLSHPFDNQTVYWPGGRNFEFTKKTEDFVGENHSWYAAYEFAAAEHGGTHLDAPYHFHNTGKRVGEIPLENLIVPLIAIDVSSKVNDDPNFVLQKQDLDSLKNYNMEQSYLLLFRFGWSKYYNDPKKYLGIEEQKKNFPGISAEAMEWITGSFKNVVGIGVDLPSVDPGSSKDFPVHKIAAKSGMYNLENLNLCSRLPDSGCTAFVMPMKLAHGTGAPLRLVAICPKQTPAKV